MPELLERIERLNEIGIALSAETDTPKLLELIMMGAMSLTRADGGSLYFCSMKNSVLKSFPTILWVSRWVEVLRMKLLFR